MDWNVIEIKFGKRTLAWSKVDEPLPLAYFGCGSRYGNWYCCQEDCNGINHYYVRG